MMNSDYLNKDSEFGKNVLKFWNVGYSVYYISSQLKVPSRYIKNFLKTNGFNRTGKESLELRRKNNVRYTHKKEAPFTEQELREACITHRTNAKLARKFNCSPNLIIQMRRFYGIKWYSGYSRKGYSIYDT